MSGLERIGTATVCIGVIVVVIGSLTGLVQVAAIDDLIDWLLDWLPPVVLVRM